MLDYLTDGTRDNCMVLSFTPPTVDLNSPRTPSARWIGSADSVRARRRYRFDHVSAVIGSGDGDFAAARRAVQRWDMARQGWTQVRPETPPITRGTQVAVSARIGPLWTTSVGIITSVEDVPGRYALSYGTTRDHVAKGEERFEVQQHPNDDVSFALTAVSRPARWWAWLGYPVVRMAQRRFRRGAIRAMRRALDR